MILLIWAALSFLSPNGSLSLGWASIYIPVLFFVSPDQFLVNKNWGEEKLTREILLALQTKLGQRSSGGKKKNQLHGILNSLWTLKSRKIEEALSENPVLLDQPEFDEEKFKATLERAEPHLEIPSDVTLLDIQSEATEILTMDGERSSPNLENNGLEVVPVSGYLAENELEDLIHPPLVRNRLRPTTKTLFLVGGGPQEAEVIEAIESGLGDPSRIEIRFDTRQVFNRSPQDSHDQIDMQALDTFLEEEGFLDRHSSAELTLWHRYLRDVNLGSDSYLRRALFGIVKGLHETLMVRYTRLKAIDLLTRKLVNSQA